MAKCRVKIILAIFCLSLITPTYCEEKSADFNKGKESTSLINISNSTNDNGHKKSLVDAESKILPIIADRNITLSVAELNNTLTKLNKDSLKENLDVAESKHLPTKTETLEEAESKDKLEIIKKIKKINNDGSYTIGYEADDGSFKIESRDVLGNVKGTYGFVDENGEIKRITYSTNNASHIFAKPQAHPEVSVVQRIPKTTIITPRPVFLSTTNSPSSTTANSVIQSIAKKHPVFLSSTTQRPKYVEIRTTSKIPAGTTATPRILLQRPSILSPVVSNDKKSVEGQLSRPVSEKPTQVSLYHTIPEKKSVDETEEKRVNEEPLELRTNVLRRQLPHPKNIKDIQTHESAEDFLYTYHHDTPDVYNTGMTEIVRPLFTTNGTPRKLFPILSSTTSAPVLVPRPTRYPNLYQRGYNVNSETTKTEQSHHVSSTEAPSSPVPTIVPVVQIPANKPEIRYAQTPEEIKYAQQNVNNHIVRYSQGANPQSTENTPQYVAEPQHVQRNDPLVAIKHPFQKGAILVPLSQLQGTILPVDDVRDVYDARRSFLQRNNQEQIGATEVQIEKQKLLRVSNEAPPLRPLPVRIDENGYIREVPKNVPAPYPISIPATPVVPLQVASTTTPKFINKYSNNEIGNEIDHIEPPVSTRDFQKLLHQLVVRQRKLEKLNEIMRVKELYQNQQQPVLTRPVALSVTPVPYILRPVPQQQQQLSSNYRQVQYDPQPQESDDYQREVAIVPRRRYHQREPLPRYQVVPSDDSFRDERLSRTSRQHSIEDNVQEAEEYLPPDVREMLLLKMLKLAINPALPVDEDDQENVPQQLQIGTADNPQYKRAPVKNVEILGEESDEDTASAHSQRIGRSKRDRDEDMMVME